MAASSEDDFSPNAVVVDGDDVKYGVRRPEVKLSGTVDSYDRHLFLCYKSHEDWPASLEDSESNSLPKLLSGALKARKNDINVKTRLTICEGSKETDGDVLIFPEMIKYRGLKDSDVDSFVEDVLMNGKPWASGLQEVLTGSHIYVCAHSSRDKRCGVCGPALIDKFKEEIELKQLKGQVFVSACSHVGDGKYAGNLIIFSADAGKKIIGHWYGYVSPSDVPELLDQHIGKGEIIERLWRGQMGAPVEAEKVEESILSNENDLNITKKAPPQEVITEEKKENVVSCREGANFRDEASEVKPEEVKPEEEGLGSCNLSRCTGKSEQREILNACSKIRHKNVVSVGKVPENMAGNFFKLCRYGKVKDQSEIVGFALDVSQGMEELHHNNIYHKDLCLENLYIDDNEVLKVAGLERCGLVTPGSTEMQEFKANDVYEFGIIVLQMITGNVDAYPDTTVIRQTLFGQIEDHLLDFPPRLLSLLRRCLAAEPSRRPSFATITIELQNVLRAISGVRMLGNTCMHKTRGCFCKH